jgi:1-acyl-sn-glycerol-3-phosphate acyltransferase
MTAGGPGDRGTRNGDPGARKGADGDAAARKPAREARVIPLHADAVEADRPRTSRPARTRRTAEPRPATRLPGSAPLASGPRTSEPELPADAEAALADALALLEVTNADPEPPTDPDTDIEDAVAAALAFLRRRLTGDYAVDDFGFDADLTDNLLLPALRPLYRTWFRVEASGLHNVAAEGGALVVANHSGTIPLDALMTSVALHDDHPAQRHLRLLGADLLFRLPVVGQLSRKHGSTLACNADAERLLGAGELVGVWPEGFKGIGKPFADRYKLQRFGRGGFVSAALRTGTPIVPCSIVGAEETYPKIGDLAPLARLLGLPYFPVTPTFPLLGPLGAVPLPSKWLIEFGEPIPTTDLGPDAADDPMLVFNLADQVRETIQHTLYRLLARRRNTFRG